MEAARTCSRLLTPSIHLISGHGHVVSQTAVQVVADVLSKLLVVGITDPGGKDSFISGHFTVLGLSAFIKILCILDLQLYTIRIKLLKCLNC